MLLLRNAPLVVLIMLFFWWDMERMKPLVKLIGLLKILGVKVGEKVDSSELKEEVVLVVLIAISLLRLFPSKIEFDIFSNK